MATLIVKLFVFLFGLKMTNGADLECYMDRNPRGHRPFLQDVCQRYKFVDVPQCLKFVQGEIVTRDCDPSFICERFNIRNRCVKGLPQAHIVGEICCCSTSLCNFTRSIRPADVISLILTTLLLLC
ncbi:hypothetical protein M3Y98_00819200 [Aphelenchoides besseyi]|nr:hypothetical protein M3Y98_00819200 [Aphelenchoides besseyi]KAI6212203.1 hypothetical protein M3Y96_00515400 [Aphelenchoides besseyi]